MSAVLGLISIPILVLPTIYGFISILSILKGFSKDVWTGLNDDVVSNPPPVALILPLYREDMNSILLTVRSIIQQNYPKDKINVFITLERGDVTFKYVDLVREMLSEHGVKLYVVTNEGLRVGKAHALNKALQLIPRECEVVVVYDAGDVVTDRNHLQKVVRLINEGNDVIGVKVYRVGSNVVGKLSFLDTVLWYNVTLPGILKIFGYPLLSGEGLALSMNFLRKVGGFPTKLTEDSYLTIYLAMLGCRASLLDVVIYEGAPKDVKSLIKQRIRWYRGYYECLADTLLKYSKELGVVKSIKLVLMYSEPLALVSSILSLVVVLMSLFTPIHHVVLTLAYMSLLLLVMAPLYIMLNLKVRDRAALIAPLYWVFQGVIALLALSPISVPWHKTVRSYPTVGGHGL